jgi:hypothetical protein
MDGRSRKEVPLIVIEGVIVENDVTVEFKGKTSYFLKLYGPKWPEISTEEKISVTFLDDFYMVISAW